jgi:outer membrane lipoprotein SlyB
MPVRPLAEIQRPAYAGNRIVNNMSFFGGNMNRIKNTPWFAAGIMMLGVLGACSQQDSVATDSTDSAAISAATLTPVRQPMIETAPAPVPVICTTCGMVRSITAVAQQGTGTGVGAALGAIVGGVAGNQVGGGSGQKIATVAGAIGGAVLGNNIEKNRNSVNYYEITIDMEGGGQQFITVADTAGISVGSAVNVQGNNISLR